MEENYIVDPVTMKDYVDLPKRPQYFNFFLESCEFLFFLSDEQVGHVMHAIADYFIDGNEPDNSEFGKEERRIYNRIKRGIDDSCKLWYSRVKGGQMAAEKRWGNDNGDS